jgi:hypothetical protein
MSRHFQRVKHPGSGAKDLFSPRESAANKKTPPGYACLDDFQVWPTGGARSRNHKKMGSPALPFVAKLFAAPGAAVCTSSGPKPNIGAGCHLEQVPSGTISADLRLNLYRYSI